MQRETIIDRASSRNDGILFYSRSHPLFCVETSRNSDDDKISAKVRLNFNYRNTLDESGLIKAVPMKKIVIIDLILIILAIFSRNLSFITAAVYFSFSISGSFFNLVNLIYQMKSKKGSNRSLARYHAAEHMACNAYDSLRRVPTLEELKTYSRISQFCGSRITFNKNFLYLSISTLLAFSNKLGISTYLTLLFIFSIIFIIVKNFNLLTFLQVLITSKPTDNELEVAIAGLQKYEEMEKSFAEHTFNNSSEIIRFILLSTKTAE